MSAPGDDPSWLADLEGPGAYPDDPGASAGIQRIDTHISHVFLTAARAYKIRRPVRLSFLDFSSAEERLADCLREVALNRRLAAEVYLGIAPIIADAAGAGVHIGRVGEAPDTSAGVVEHCVVMRRLPTGRDLRSMLARGEATDAHVDRIAERLASFHAAHSLGRPSPSAAEDWLARATAPARANIDTLAAAPPSLAPPAEVDEARRLAARFVEEWREDFDARRADGRVVDGHGDLHTEHVWFEHDSSEPLMIDCLEFRDDFRCIDAASDIAFLAMDLTYQGRADLAARFLRRYARAGGDYHLFAVVDYFLSYRALVRAKVASLVATDASMSAAQRDHAVESVRRHLDLALGFLAPRGPGSLVLTCGTIGTGKTTVAEALADVTGGVVISSDWLRRDTVQPAREAPYGGGRYSEQARAAVYDRLLAEARHVVKSGRTVILDATWARRSRRDAAVVWARQHARDCVLIEVVAERDDVIARLAARATAGNDASEAGPGLYDAIRAEFEDPAEWPSERRARVDTSAADWREQVALAARSVRIA